jgi:FtsP/CotA-like multicopper oxidase with cupredoxin domain
MTTGLDPYQLPVATDDADTGVGSPVLETTFVASVQPVDIDGSGNLIQAEVFNGAIPGPTLRLDVGQTAVVRLVNDLPVPTGIHWHGIELANYADGTEVTQDGAVAGSPPVQMLGGTPGAPGVAVPAGGTYLYKFKVTRPGLFWYHPHHHNSLNRLFRGMYGMIVVRDPLEASLVGTVLPTDTMQVVLSDITVCRTPGLAPPPAAGNYTATYSDYAAAEWLSEPVNPTKTQNAPSPKELCEISPAGTATDDFGNLLAAPASSYNAGEVPSGMRPAGLVRAGEGQTVLTNGMYVGGRLGTPGAPGALVSVAGTPAPRGVTPGQGLRLQIVNCAVLRYFRLRLTDAAGVQIDLVRIGGEGGLLDNAILEGGMIGNLDTNFSPGEILLPPATRADVIVAIPTGADGTVLTLWTRDYQRTGNGNPGNWAQLPTVPVMHLSVTGPQVGATYTITGGDVNVSPPNGTALRAPAGMMILEDLTPLATSTLLLGPVSPPPAPPRPPAAGTYTGFVNSDIQIVTIAGVTPRIDNIAGMFMASPTYAQIPHLGSSRYAEEGRVYELTVTNTSSAHHPFHLHGFSFQPVSIAPRTAPGTPNYTWTYREFRDTIDVPRDRTLKFRVRTDPRALADEITPGGALGRWLFHCHIFFHHTRGMVGEFVVATADVVATDYGREKPNVNVGGSWAYTSVPGTATRQGTFYQRNGLVTTLAATRANGTMIGTINFPPGVSQGAWQWTYNSPIGDMVRKEYVYITATDSDGRKDQAVFRLQVGGVDDGSDVGDPHLRTVDGTRYDFQAAGEFTLLRDREGMEIQVRQTPVETPPPITDDYSGLTACVSLNTAVAARVGSHRIAFQPSRADGDPRGRHVFFLDGQPEMLTTEGIDLDGHRVSGFDAAGEMALRVDFAHNAVLIVTPRLWTSYGIRYLDVTVSKTQADEGIMGRIAKGSWLPALRSGATVGPRAMDLFERHVQLYRTFANSWRVGDITSLFVYEPHTSTATFTDEDWPPPPVVGDDVEFPRVPACKLKAGFREPITPIRENIDLAEARRICEGVTLDDLHDACVFDVAATGDASIAKGYLVAQDLRLNSTTVQIVGDKPQTQATHPLVVTAIVAPLSSGRPTPTGSVTFMIDGVAAGTPVTLDRGGRASFTTKSLGIGEHMIRATYASDRTYHPSSSPNLLHMVMKSERGVRGTNVLYVPTIWIWILLLLLLLLIVITIAVYIASR